MGNTWQRGFVDEGRRKSNNWRTERTHCYNLSAVSLPFPSFRGNLMKITIEVPDTMREPLREQFGQDVSGAVKEALAVALYRAQKLSIGRVAELLGTSINEANGLMKRWDVEASLSPEEFEHDRMVLSQLLQSQNGAESSIEPRACRSITNMAAPC